ncbi:MAG: glycosyltransferase family 39 protein [Alphaproteobacteria bacterium]|nr:glycosyltransferase family 39 protein [Alphaproteobacteria bacterium]
MTHSRTAPSRGLLERYPLLFLGALCLCLWLPALVSLPALDRDESRFAQSSKQMLESGNFVDIRFGKEARYNKPAGIYWLQAATTSVVGLGDRDQIWTYRLASLLGGLAAVWLTYWCCRAVTEPLPALVGAGSLATTLLLSAEASIATTDAVLLACIVAVQGVLLRAYLARARPEAMPGRSLLLAGWAALGAGILVKGPVAPAVCGITILGLWAWDRDARWLRTLRPLSGALVAILVIAPWLAVIGFASHGLFFQQSLGHDFALKVVSGQETHGAPPGYYLGLAAVTLWPASLFVLPALRDGIRGHSNAAARFNLTWAATTWLLFELIPTKLPHYILPAYPALMILVALWWASPQEPRSEAAWRWASAVLFLAVLAAAAVACVLLPSWFGDRAGVGEILLLFAAGGAGLGALAAAVLGRRLLSAAAALAGAIVLHIAIVFDATEHMGRLWVSQNLASLVAHVARLHDPAVLAAGYTEPSLLFLLGTKTVLVDDKAAATDLGRSPGLELVEERDLRALKTGLAAAGLRADVLGEVSGFDYSRGRKVRVVLVRVSGRGPIAISGRR